MSELKGKTVDLKLSNKSLTAAFVVSEVDPKSHGKVLSQVQASRAQSNVCKVQPTKEEFCELIAGNVQLKVELEWQYSLIKEMESLVSAQRRYLEHVTVALFQAQLEAHRERERALEVLLEQVLQGNDAFGCNSAAEATGYVLGTLKEDATVLSVERVQHVVFATPVCEEIAAGQQARVRGETSVH